MHCGDTARGWRLFLPVPAPLPCAAVGLGGADGVSIRRHVGWDIGNLIEDIRDDRVWAREVGKPITMNFDPAKPT